ncbi:MAG: hypothetical protein CVU00_11565 [Bacteroidetes bacterium HGW-Bacteroidetes-17]|jgi:hypothetical protein|nr:MAG: hypothetical protein CVU00_11565 [Bacteroidetes bacterium HGW-Bacteroidetes-17]
MIFKIIKKYKYLLIVGLIVGGYFAIAQVLPKSLSRYPAFVIIFLLDIYLWSAIKSWISRQSKIWEISLNLLYWLPLAMIVSTTIISLFKPIQTWNTSVYLNISGFALICYTAKIFTTLFILLTDFIRGMKFILRFAKTKRTKQIKKAELPLITRNKFIKNLGLLTGGVILSGMLVGRFKWASAFKLRSEDIILPKLPQAFNGLKIIQFSDLHLGSWPSSTPISEIAEIINEQDADLVFFTGDLVNFSTSEAFKFEEILKEITAPLGVFSILGNHDYGDYVNWETDEAKEDNMQQLYDLHNRIGWKLLRNENHILEKNGSKLAILGVENWGDNPRFPKKADMNKTLEGIENDTLQLLLSHDPSHWDKVISKKYKHIDLTFSGHTHGFQFGIETSLFRWSPAQYLYKYWAGLYRIKSQFLYVSRGTGYLGYPGRIGISPEITLFTLNNE